MWNCANPATLSFGMDADSRVYVQESIVGRIKGYTSYELRQEFPRLKRRLPTLWKRSKFISSVGAVTLEAVQAYIEGQKPI